MKKSFILLLVGVALFGMGCGTTTSRVTTNDVPTPAATAPAPTPAQPGWTSFSNSTIYPKVSVSFPPSYHVEDGTDIHALVIKKSPTARVEIFQMKDFGGDRPLGFEDTTATQAEIDVYIPKLQINRHGYDVWYYYSNSDTASRDELLNIVDTMTVKP